ncbi:MAG: leucine-rich repeat protein, partial [Firmicutes bacterium]|nr:leucine-rich repeat protein [Bacillota bacterium]
MKKKVLTGLIALAVLFTLLALSPALAAGNEAEPDAAAFDSALPAEDEAAAEPDASNELTDELSNELSGEQPQLLQNVSGLQANGDGSDATELSFYKLFIYDVPMPVVGAYADASSAKVMLDYSSSYSSYPDDVVTVEGVYSYMPAGRPEYMSSTQKFSSSYTYYMEMMVYAADGYVFPDSLSASKVYLDGICLDGIATTCLVVSDGAALMIGFSVGAPKTMPWGWVNSEKTGWWSFYPDDGSLILDGSSYFTVSAQSYDSDLVDADGASITSPWHAYWNDITSLGVSQYVTKITGAPCYNMPNLDDVNFYGDIELAGSTFYNCSALTNAYFSGDLILSNDNDAFHQTGLRSLTVNGDAVLQRGFSYCKDLTTVTFKGNAELGRSGSYYGPFEESGVQSMTFCGPATLYRNAFDDTDYLTRITFQDQVYFGKEAFSWLSSSSAPPITTLELPAGSMLEADAFDNVSDSLKTLILHDLTPPDNLDNNVGHTPTSLWLYVPAAAVDDYKAALSSDSRKNHVLPIPTGTTSSGDCGSDATWIYDTTTHTLTVSGTGTVTSGTWGYFQNQIQTLVVEEGITQIGNSAFAGLSGLYSVYLPSTLTRLNEKAFQNDTGIRDVSYNGTPAEWSSKVSVDTWYNGNQPLTDYLFRYTVPGSTAQYRISSGGRALYLYADGAYPDVSNYGVWKTEYKDTVTEVYVTDGVTGLPAATFDGMSNLRTVHFPLSLTSIGKNCFRGCNADGVYVYYSGTHAQWDQVTKGSGNTLLGKAGLDWSSPADLQGTWPGGNWYSKYGDLFVFGSGDIPDYAAGQQPWAAALYEMESGDDIYVSRSGEYDFDGETYAITGIGQNAFAGAPLEQVYLGSTITSIGKNAFAGCPTASYVSFGGTYSQWYDVTIASGNEAILNASEFSANNGSGSGTWGNGGTWTLSYGTLTISGLGVMPDYAEGEQPWADIRVNIDDVKVEEGITAIGKNAFRGINRLDDVYLPASLTSIGENAFYGCPAADLNYSGTLAQWDAVTIAAGNDAITDPKYINIESSSDSGTWSSASYSGTWTVSYGTLTISGSGTLPAYSNGAQPWAAYLPEISEVVVESGITGLGNNAFRGASRAYKLTLPAGLNSIGYNVFAGWKQHPYVPGSYSSYYDQISFGGTIGQWDNMAVSSGNDWLDTVYSLSCTATSTGGTITNGGKEGSWYLTSYGQLQISYDGDGPLTMPNYSSVSDVPWYAYRDQIRSVTVYGVSSVGTRAFQGCTGLRWVKLGNDVATITSLAFSGCTHLESITLPAGLTKVNKNAFNNCTALTEATYAGTPSAWANVTVATGNDALTAAFHWQIGKDVNQYGDGWKLRDGVLTVNTYQLLGDYTSASATPWYQHRSLITGIVVKSNPYWEGDNVPYIGKNCFRGLSSVTSVELPACLREVRDYAFAGCSALKTATYAGSASQWAAVTVGTNNAYLLNALTCTGSGGSGQALAITSQPQDFTGPAGATIKFTVGASGDGLTYQWYYKKSGETTFNKSTLASATKKTFTMTMADKYDGWQYYCIVTDSSYNMARTQTVFIHKGTALAVTTQPTDFYGAAGDTVKFTVAATGDGLSYQWYFKRAGESSFSKSTVAAATKATFTMTMADKYDGWQYYCVVSDSHGSTIRSNTVTIYKGTKLAITTQPTDFYGKAGDTVKFTVAAGGDGLTYQWYYKKTDAASFALSTVTAATTATFSMTMADKYDGWQYYCIVKDSHGKSVKSDTVTIYKGTKLSITTQPKSYTGAAGGTATFKVAAKGDGLTYQWYYQTATGTTWSKATADGNTTATLSVPVTTGRDGYKYRCIIKDSHGKSVTSDTVKLCIGTPLKITTQPVNYAGAVGSTCTFKVVAQGDGLTYQWYYKTPSASAFTKSTTTSGTKATYTLTLAAKHDGYQYYCIVSDSHGSTVKTNTVKITVGTELKITTQPKSYTGAAGGTATFKVVAQGDGLTYQWYYQTASGTTWSKATATGNTTATLSVPVTTGRDGYKYRCTVKDSHGNSVNSSTVTLTVGTPLKITTQPVNYTGAAGSTATFKVVAQGDGLTYQWYYKKTDATSFTKSTLSSGTKATYSMTIADKHDGWQYYCLVKDSHGNSVKSNTVKINIGTPLKITTQPSNFSGAAGSTISFKVVAQGDGLTYQWYYKKTDASGFAKSTVSAATKATFTMTMADKYDGWQYYCLVKDSHGNSVKSNTVKIIKGTALKITTQPVNFTGAAGSTITFKVVA